MSPLQRTVTGKDRRDLWLSHFISVIFEFQSRAMGDLRPHREFVAKLQLGYHDEQSNSSISDITPKCPPLPLPFFFFLPDFFCLALSPVTFPPSILNFWLSFPTQPKLGSSSLCPFPVKGAFSHFLTDVWVDLDLLGQVRRAEAMWASSSVRRKGQRSFFHSTECRRASPSGSQALL